jgi:hypothetical protein
MAESADAAASKAVVRKDVRVQVPLRAPRFTWSDEPSAVEAGLRSQEGHKQVSMSALRKKCLRYLHAQPREMPTTKGSVSPIVVSVAFKSQRGHRRLRITPDGASAQYSVCVSEPLTPTEANRRAASVNELLRQISQSNGAITEWWNHAQYPQIGNRTPTQAWLAGDHQAVEQLVAEWCATSEAAAERHRNDAQFMAMLRKKSTALRSA